MSSFTGIAYARRQNPDGTTDSICRNCFDTVVTAWREADLNHAEHSHTCDPYVLEYWKNAVQHGAQLWRPQF